MSYSSTDVKAEGTNVLQKRRKRRQIRRFSAVSAVIYVAAQFGFQNPTSTEPLEPEHRFVVPPLWRPAASVLDRPVAHGPWQRPQPTELSGLDESTRELIKWNTVFSFARRYRIEMELAELIHDTALDEKIEPELAFRLVKLESRFDPNAVSSAGAIGLTQLMPGTARYFQPGISADELTHPETNLRIGFRYLRGLIREYDGDLKIALLVYNRGPTAVMNALAVGEDPANGYDRLLMRGYAGRGVVE